MYVKVVGETYLAISSLQQSQPCGNRMRVLPQQNNKFWAAVWTRLTAVAVQVQIQNI